MYKLRYELSRNIFVYDKGLAGIAHSDPLSLVFGVLILINPFGTAELLFRIIGIALIYNGVSDLLTVFYFSKKTRY